MNYEIILDNKVIYITKKEKEAINKAKLLILNDAKKIEIWKNKELFYVILSPLCRECNDSGIIYTKMKDIDYTYEIICNCDLGKMIKEQFKKNAIKELELKWM